MNVNDMLSSDASQCLIVNNDPGSIQASHLDTTYIHTYILVLQARPLSTKREAVWGLPMEQNVPPRCVT